ncbi:MAG: flagellar basal body rod C-terminal domain-containing protein [Candidatus Puniceispirillales bacterium]
MDGPLSTASYLGSKVKISSSTNTSSNSFLISGIDLNGKIISETITGSNSSSVISSNIFQKINSISVSGSISSMIKVGTVGSDGNWNVAIDANALEINSALEISSALASELRIGTPISQLKGEVVSKIPSEGSRVELSFEGQIYTAEIINGEVIVNGPESNRIKARLNGTSSLDIDAISSSQSGTASTALVLNGIEAVLSDQDGLVENQTIGSAGNLTISGALSTKASTLLNSLITISSVNNNASDTFTITGTDIDGVVQTETITGVNNNTVTGTKVFKTVTQIASNGATSGINVGTISVIANKDGTRVSISSMGNETKNSFTISGTDVDGLAQTETIFGANSGGTVYSSRLFKTISSITPTLSTNGNIQVGTAPGYQFIATAEGTVEGDQFRVVQNNSNLSFASGFGISSGIATLKGNLVPKPVNADEGIRINVKVGSSENKYTIKFDTNGVPQFYNRIGSSISASPPSGLSLAWNDVSGTTDDDALFNSNMSAGVSIVTNGALSTTDDDSLFTSKSSTAGNLILDGTLKSSQELNGIVTVFCAGNETGNSFKVSGYDMSGTYVTDTITGGNNSEVSGSVSFKEVLSINVSNDTASTIKVGTQATSVTFAPSSITVTPSGSDVGETYTVIGLDQFGRSQTEVLTAEAAGTTVYGKKVFSQVSSFLPTSGSASSVKVGTQAVGNLSLSHNVDSMSFSLDSNPNAEIQYGLKTQHTRLTFDTNGLNILNLSGEAVNLEVPLNSIQNSVAEQVTVKNLPNEELIAFVMGGGARKFSTEFDINENKENIIDPEVSIKVDSSNSNKIEIFDKMSGHSIGTRIIDQNRLFEFDGNKFQFSDQPLIKNNFIFSSNQSGTGDARNILNMLKLQLEDATNQGKGNFQQIFSNTVAKVGSNVQANKLSLAAASSNKDSAEASQSEFAGVNLDEEAGHLLEYQQAYQASARILQTARELFQSLLDVVGR